MFVKQNTNDNLTYGLYPASEKTNYIQMKNIIAILLFIGFSVPSPSLFAQEVKQNSFQSVNAEKIDSVNIVKKKLTAKQSTEISSDKKAEEQRKKEIEAKEHSVNKNKKVRRFGVDENLSNTIRKRNIP